MLNKDTCSDILTWRFHADELPLFEAHASDQLLAVHDGHVVTSRPVVTSRTVSLYSLGRTVSLYGDSYTAFCVIKQNSITLRIYTAFCVIQQNSITLYLHGVLCYQAEQYHSMDIHGVLCYPAEQYHSMDIHGVLCYQAEQYHSIVTSRLVVTSRTVSLYSYMVSCGNKQNSITL